METIWIILASLSVGCFIGAYLVSLNMQRLFPNKDAVDAYQELFDKQQRILNQQKTLLHQAIEEKARFKIVHSHLVDAFVELKKQHERTLSVLN